LQVRLLPCSLQRVGEKGEVPPSKAGYPAGMMAASSRNPTTLSDLLLD